VINSTKIKKTNNNFILNHWTQKTDHHI